MKAKNGYTVERRDNRMVVVSKAKAVTRFIYMEIGAAHAGTCNCPSYGKCGHQLAAEEFAEAERQPVAKHTPSRQEILSDMYFGWA